MTARLTLSVQIHDDAWKKLLRPHIRTVREACELALEAGFRTQSARLKKIKRLELTVVLGTDALVKKLNRDFRGQNKPTNVLSFPCASPDAAIVTPEFYLGDIVLARQTVMREAKEQKKDPRDHAVHLLVHGVLHLLGYDHMADKEAEDMEREEIKTLKKLGISNPYL